MQITIGLLKLLDGLGVGVRRASLSFDESFKLLKPSLLKGDLGMQVLLVALGLSNMLLQRYLFVLKARDLPLELSLVGFLVTGNALKCGQFFDDLLSLCGHLVV